MDKITNVIVVLIILIILGFFYQMKYSDSFYEKIKYENFKVNSQNWINNNAFGGSNNLSYGNDDNLNGIYNNNTPDPMGPSDKIGVNQNSGKDVFDNRGYKWSYNSADPQVDTFTDAVDNSQLRNNFERTYMLDPNGSVAQYDITYNKVSPSCCPAQYAPPFKLGDKDSSNCDVSQQYVANQYSGMNYNNGNGCVCITPKQADFYGSRGGNTD
jgi:hypothetical protein